MTDYPKDYKEYIKAKVANRTLFLNNRGDYNFAELLRYVAENKEWLIKTDVLEEVGDDFAIIDTDGIEVPILASDNPEAYDTIAYYIKSYQK